MIDALTEALEADAAVAADAPADYHARGAAAELFRCRAREVLIEGPAGTGKTRAVLEKINWLCDTHPRLRVLICRATRASMTESVLVTLEEKVFWPGHPALASSNAGRAHRASYDYTNGSTIVVGGLDSPDRLFSTEWDIVYVAEATEITVDAWEKFRRALRNGRGPYHQAIADCNPVQPGHWLNRRAGTDRMVRLRSRHEDNPSVTAEFLEGLRQLTGHRRARLYEGRWVSSEGVVFPEFDERRHVRAPFAVPEHWPWYVGLDPGYDHPCAILWFTVAENGVVYIADELYRGGLGIPDHARDIHARNAGRTIKAYFADPQHAFSRTAQSPKTIAEQLRECGLTFQPWPRTGTGSAAMVEAVRQRIVGDRLRVFSTCTETIREFQSWAYKRSAGGEVPAGDDQFEDRDNHCLAADTLVWTMQGKRRIADLVGREGELLTPYGPRRFFDVHRNGQGNVYRWTFTNGVTLDATEEHEIQLISGDWKTLGNLQSNDLIYCGDEPQNYHQQLPGVRRISVLPEREVLRSERASRDGLRLEKRATASGRVGVPPWRDPYGLAHPSRQRGSGGQPDRESGVHASGRAFGGAHDAGATCVGAEKLRRQGGSGGCCVAQEQSGAKVARAAGGEEHRPAVGAAEDVCVSGVRGDVQCAVRADGEVLPAAVQLEGAGAEETGTAARLQSVEYIGVADVFDLSVEDVRCFFVNGGAVVSNSMDVVKGALAAIAPRIESSNVVHVYQPEW